MTPEQEQLLKGWIESVQYRFKRHDRLINWLIFTTLGLGISLLYHQFKFH